MSIEEDPIFEYLNSKQAQNDIKDMQWVAFTNKYNDTHLAFKDSPFNISVIDNIRPDYYITTNNLIDFYDILGKRIALCLNYFKGKTTEEIEQMIKDKE